MIGSVKHFKSNGKINRAMSLDADNKALRKNNKIWNKVSNLLV